MKILQSFRNAFLGGELVSAAEEGRIEDLKRLIAMGVNINAKKGGALRAASINGRINIIRLLFENGVDVNCDNGFTLYQSVQKDHHEVTRMLIEKGAYINCISSDGKTTLMHAVSKGCTDIVRLLIEKGANVNCISNDGRTTLMYAVSKGHTDIVRLLIEKGVDVNAKSISGVTALAIYAVVEECPNDIAGLLINNGADINAGCNLTPLMEATSHGFKDKVKYLIEMGANTKKKIYFDYNKELTAIHVARAAENLNVKGAKEIIKMIDTANKKQDLESYFGLSITEGHKVKYCGPIEHLELDGNDAKEILFKLLESKPSIQNIVLVPLLGLVIINNSSTKYGAIHFKTPIESKIVTDIIKTLIDKGKKLNIIEKYNAFELL
jgi:ankyrin repeat protein